MTAEARGRGGRPLRLFGPALLAFALTLAYAWWLAPAWEPQLNDQEQYLSLARGLVERGAFTRARPGEPFIAETNRLPGYALLLAPSCLGGCDRWRVAGLQALLLAALVIVAGALARRAVPARATAAAYAVALFVPFAYYGALALSDLPAAVLVALGAVAWIRARDAARAEWAIAAGALLGWAALMRGALLLLPLGLAAAALARDRRALRIALACVAAAALVVAPYVAYSETSFGRPFAGNGGAVLWLGALQGRGEADLDEFERREVAAARTDIAAFDAMPDRQERALAWLDLDAALAAHARALIAHDAAGWIARAVPRSVELFAGDRPVPGGASGDRAAAIGALELVVTLVGLIGVVRLWRRDRTVGEVVAIVVAYVWLSALPFGTEGRYALPARPFLLIAFAAMLDLSAWRPGGRRAPSASRPSAPAAPGAGARGA